MSLDRVAGPIRGSCAWPRGTVIERTVVCVATWNCCRMTSESSSALRMACRRWRRVSLHCWPLAWWAGPPRQSQLRSLELPLWSDIGQWHRSFPVSLTPIWYTRGVERIWCLFRDLYPVPSLGTIYVYIYIYIYIHMYVYVYISIHIYVCIDIDIEIDM